MALVLTEKQEAAQIVLAGGAKHIMGFGGSRSGKTFLLLLAVVKRALKAPGSRHAVFRFRFNSVKNSVVLDTFPKVMRLAFPSIGYKLDRTDWYATIPNGAQIWFAGLDDKERTEKVLGMEFVTIYFNECSQIPLNSINMAVTRLAQQVDQVVDGVHKPLKPKVYYDENPPSKAHWSYKIFIEKVDPETGLQLDRTDDYAAFKINPLDNVANIAGDYLDTLSAMSARMRRRFLEGEFADATPGALFTDEIIERWRHEGALPDMVRIVVAVDPSGSDEIENAENDAVGIVVAGLGTDGIGYVLDDSTMKGGPASWGKRVCELFVRYKADLVVGEVNYGGAMVNHVIQTERPGTPFRAVTASRGKVVRAEPFSGPYENGTIRHAGKFPELEEELTSMTTHGYVGGNSPNRADAAIWALTELFPIEVHKPVMTTAVNQFALSPFKIPVHWRRGFAMSIEGPTCRAMWGAYDKDSDVLYLIAEYKRDYAEPMTNAQAINLRGTWIPGVFDCDETNLKKFDEMVRLYVTSGIAASRLIPADRAEEAGVGEVQQRIASQRLKVISTCFEFFKDYRGYRRDDSGALIGGGMMNCARQLARPTMLARMITEPAVRMVAQPINPMVRSGRGGYAT